MPSAAAVYKGEGWPLAPAALLQRARAPLRQGGRSRRGKAKSCQSLVEPKSRASARLLCRPQVARLRPRAYAPATPGELGRGSPAAARAPQRERPPRRARRQRGAPRLLLFGWLLLSEFSRAGLGTEFV